MRAAVVAREVRQMLQAGKKRYALMDFMPVVKMEHDRTEANNAALLSAKINAYMFSRPNVIVKPAQRRQA